MPAAAEEEEVPSPFAAEERNASVRRLRGRLLRLATVGVVADDGDGTKKASLVGFAVADAASCAKEDDDLELVIVLLLRVLVVAVVAVVVKAAATMNSGESDSDKIHHSRVAMGKVVILELVGRRFIIYIVLFNCYQGRMDAFLADLVMMFVNKHIDWCQL